MEMDEIERDVESIQMTIEQAQAHVRLGDALKRLQDNPDFQLLIMTDYFKDQTVRLGHLLSDNSMQSKKHRKSIIREIEAIGVFLSYLRVISQRAEMSREAIRVNQEELRTIAEEGNH